MQVKKSTVHGRLRQRIRKHSTAIVQQAIYGAATAAGAGIVSLITITVERLW